MPILIGTGTREVLKSIFADMGAKVDVVDQCGVSWSLRFVMEYKHLDTMLDYRRSRAQETSIRVGKCSSAARALFKTIGRADLTSIDRWRFACSLSLSKPAYNVHTDTLQNAHIAKRR